MKNKFLLLIVKPFSLFFFTSRPRVLSSIFVIYFSYVMKIMTANNKPDYILGSLRINPLIRLNEFREKKNTLFSYSTVSFLCFVLFPVKAIVCLYIDCFDWLNFTACSIGYVLFNIFMSISIIFIQNSGNIDRKYLKHILGCE